LLERLAGDYITPTKVKFQVLTSPHWSLAGLSRRDLPEADPHQGLKFRTPQFADNIWEFVMENGKVTALKERNPEGEFTFPRQ